ncbi:REP-associated tyrosine transposase [Alienimonas chondri]|uniref:Transposase IS200-like domain-containing protein n=1 Tax=Alienimonas chondri TaxID=2681879 RepID=A0ABX1VHK9_9PLAN|nr:transposase [Alienimonas chondri]NNJ27322.1 hypothetical protein [Alienimonas chondri]
MARRRNYNDPGHAHSLTFCCYRRLPLLAKDRSRNWLCEAINAAREELAYDVWAYVLMPEHVHLLVCPRERVYDIAAFRKAIKEPVGRAAMAYLKQHAPDFLSKLTRRRGRRVERLFWQSGGGHDRNVFTLETLRAQIDYLHLNPVRRRLCERATDWAWSSARDDAAADRGTRRRNAPVSLDLGSLPALLDGGRVEGVRV